jgi:DNA polymerase I-like protein with 3'-5' exonuclease and polymerase domains
MPKFKPTYEAYQLLHEGTQVLAEIESNGVRVDKDYLDQTITEIDEQIIEATNEMKKDKVIYPLWRKRFGNNMKLGSRDQLAKILQRLGYVLPKTEKDKR